MPAKFDEVAFGLSENTVSEPFETQFGYHIVKVNKIYPETYEKFQMFLKKLNHSSKNKNKTIYSIQILIFSKI